MKKYLLMLLTLLAVMLCTPALAQEAEDITAQCKVEAASSKNSMPRLTDRDWGTNYKTLKQRWPFVSLTAPEEGMIHGIYVCFGDKLHPWQVQAKHGKEWVTVFESEGKYAHEYAALPQGETQVRVTYINNKQIELNISEIFAFSEGEIPASVQQWQPTPEKADLLILSAHPDDEVLFFGGTIPYYAGEKGMNVVVAYMTCGTMERRSELLNGLWSMGVKTYPVIEDFWDKYTTKLDKAYDAWGKSATNKFIVSLLRQYKPEVVVTHDVNGEYGHGAHRVCADAMKKCVGYAADKSKYTDTVKKYGTWEVKKLYLHLAKENAIEMDWDQPLAAFNGKTGYEMAVEGYSWHVSQHDAGQKNPETGKYEPFVVEPRESDYSCYRFGLVHSTVGPDVEKNDFFENIIIE